MRSEGSGLWALGIGRNRARARASRLPLFGERRAERSVRVSGVVRRECATRLELFTSSLALPRNAGEGIAFTSTYSLQPTAYSLATRRARSTTHG